MVLILTRREDKSIFAYFWKGWSVNLIAKLSLGFMELKII